MNKKNESVQMMRGIAALSVVVCHLGYGTGMFGVDLFFCISGFIMMLVTEKSCDGFMFKRFLRICPLYYSLTVGSFAMGIIAPHLLRSPETGFDNLLRSFLFIGNKEHEPIVGVGWTLCYEMFFYLLFFIAFKISHNNRCLIAAAFLVTLVLTGIIVKPENAYLAFYTQPILLEFVLGMFAFKVVNRTMQCNIMQYNIILLLALVIYGSLFFFTIPADRLIAAGIPTFVFFVLTYNTLINRKIIHFFVVLGNISYSLYLTHTFVITVFSRFIWLIDCKLTLKSIAASILAVSVAVGVAYLSWYLIENKLTDWIKTKI